MTEMPTVLNEFTLSNTFIGDTVQVCIVTSDWKRVLAGFVALGVGPWRVYKFQRDKEQQQTYRGQALGESLIVCAAMRGNMVWEVIQPIDGQSIYKDFLARHGEGVHHVAIGLPEGDFGKLVAEFGKRNVPVIASGDIWDGKLDYAYLGTEPMIGTTLEAYRLPDGPMPEPDEWFPGPPPVA